MKKIVKRDGRVVNFNENKISVAIKKASQDVKVDLAEEVLEELTDKVVERLDSNFDYKKKKPTVEEIQDIVEKILTEANQYEILRGYIVYREERAKIRERKSDLMKTFKDISFTDSLNVDLKRENGNINGDTAMGKMLRFGSEGSKQFSLLELMNEKASKAHKAGDIHVHDLDFASTGTLTCNQIDLERLFDYGFSTGHGSIRTPNDIKTYASLACIAIQGNQNEMHRMLCQSEF